MPSHVDVLQSNEISANQAANSTFNFPSNITFSSEEIAALLTFGERFEQNKAKMEAYLKSMIEENEKAKKYQRLIEYISDNKTAKGTWDWTKDEQAQSLIDEVNGIGAHLKTDKKFYSAEETIDLITRLKDRSQECIRNADNINVHAQKLQQENNTNWEMLWKALQGINDVKMRTIRRWSGAVN